MARERRRDRVRFEEPERVGADSKGPAIARMRAGLVRFLRAASCVAAVSVVLVAWAGCELTGRVRRKEELEHVDASPTPARELGPPELQLEDHTCGLHALRIVYRAHGLDPDAERLRERLGVDTPALPKAPSTTGTLHPDLMRVLRQDHFDTALIDPDLEGAATRLESLLTTPLASAPVLLLVDLGNEALHWVAAARSERAGHVRVWDSLVREPYDEPLDSYLRQRVLSIVMVTPHARVDVEPLESVYAEGLAEMWRVARRMDARRGARATSR